MKILVLAGSPHKSGASNMLAHEFICGARDKGHNVAVLDVAHMKLGYCSGCDECKKNGECVQKDDSAVVREEMLSADAVVFVTPVYYFGMSAQLKTAIDRFHGYGKELKNKGMKSAIIAAAADKEEEVVSALKAHYAKICSYLNFEIVGEVYGLGCAAPETTRNSSYMKDAYELGNSL